MRSPLPNALLAGRYTIEEPIGRGRSTVYRATDTRLHRPVAVKEVLLHSDHESDDRVRRRALREARSAARLTNPSVVTVFDVIEEEGSIWLVMELVDAPSMSQLVVDGGPLDHARAARIGLDVLDALDEAHAAGIVHRDVKPANVLVDPGGHAKLADFGVATVSDDTRMTATGLVIGSPAYMAPEQARGEDAEAPADLWALGATLYFAYEGVPPFDAGSVVATATAVVHAEPRPEQRPGPLSPIVGRLLAKDPARRPSTADLRRTLQTVAGRSTAASATSASTATTPAPVAPDRPPSRSRVRRGLAASGVVALLAAAVWLLRPDSGGDPTSSAPPDDEPPAATTTAAPPPQEQEAGVPDGWQDYTDTAAGYTIGYPPGWEVVPAGGTRTDFRDPSSGTSLRVDWTATPKDDPVADWQQQAQRFAGSHDGYEEVGIAAYEYRDYDAALWEFRYDVDGTRRHAADLGFVTGNRGYALYFQTDDARWAASQDLFAQFRASFRPAA